MQQLPFSVWLISWNIMSHKAWCGLGLASLWCACSGGVGFPDHLGPLVLTLPGQCVCVCYCLHCWDEGHVPWTETDTKGIFRGWGCAGHSQLLFLGTPELGEWGTRGGGPGDLPELLDVLL